MPLERAAGSNANLNQDTVSFILITFHPFFVENIFQIVPERFFYDKAGFERFFTILTTFFVVVDNFEKIVIPTTSSDHLKPILQLYC